MVKITWPDINFGPVNLWTMVSAYWFYMTPEERLEEFRRVSGGLINANNKEMKH